MSQLNPDFRSADEITTVGPQGWTDGTLTEQQAIDFEKAGADRLESDMPVAFRSRAADVPDPIMVAKWNEFQKSKGRFPGSCDWTLLDEFVHGKPIVWKPQIIGSCVMSNTMGSLVARGMYQVALLGQPNEYLGRNEFGPQNYAAYGPFSYGAARKRANMRSGDGLYCEAMVESLMKDGQISCSTPKLLEILKSNGLDGAEDFPEPQGNDGAAFYRAMGNWKHLDELRPYADFLVTEMSYIKSADQLVESLKAGKPTFVCSMEAIHKVGTHPDGFAIHARNPRDSWAHNMAFRGYFVASDGEEFIRESNESWGADHIYNRKLSEVDKAIRTGGLTIASVGNINLPGSAPLAA